MRKKVTSGNVLKWAAGLLAVVTLAGFLIPAGLEADDKKKKKKEAEKAAMEAKIKAIDYSSIVWPNPPAIARIKYVNWFSSDREVRNLKGNVQKKNTWMDRLAGTQSEDEVFSMPFQLNQPYGIAIDSKGQVYVADHKVGAIFIFNTDTRAVDLIKNGSHAHFARIIGLAMDDSDRLFVSDPGLRHILIFNKDHKAEDVITDGLAEPSGMVVDNQNRLLYVADVELDQVLVYDADTLKLLRKIGTTGHNHELTTPGDFAKPSGVALDKEGNLYVADTLNNRIEIFDPDGNFVSTFGKNGDGPGYFARPKGVAIDSDGHVWVADGMQDRIQVFTKEGQLLIAFGGHGLLPGQFQGLVDIAIDKQDRVFTTEIYPGRLQEMQYITDAQADKEREKRAAERATRASAQHNAPASQSQSEVVPLPAPTAKPQ